MSDPVLALKRDPCADPTLSLLPGAAAVFDAQLSLVRANQAFLDLCTSPRPGAPLSALLKAARGTPLAPADNEETAYLASSVTGEPVEVRLRRTGGEVGALARPAPLDTADAPLAQAMHSLAEQEQEQAALLSLSREVALAASEDELVAAIAHCVRRLFPGRHFCVRIVDPRTATLTSMYAEGRLIEGGREKLAMRRAAAEKARLDARGLPGSLTLTEEDPLIFVGAKRGFATPLAAAGRFFGLLNLEYPSDFSPDVHRDEQLLIQLANQASVGLRNAKLIDEHALVKKYLEELIENANALILVTNARREIIIFNRAMVELSGRTRSQVVGRSVDALIPPGSREALARTFEKSLRGDRVSNFETALLDSDGLERKVTFNTSPIVNPGAEVEGVLAIGQDLSRQKELERRVVQAEKLATLGQLAAGVAHEINNPLSTITLYSESLLQLAQVRRSDPADLDKLSRIKESADRILKFARDLTSYARPAPAYLEELDLPDLVDQAARYCEHVIKQSNAVIARAYGAVPKVHAVRANLVQVFVNLLTNACHALPPSGGRIEITTRVEGDGAEIEVKDTGGGIREQDLPRIFEPFYTTKPEGHGTGLGLAIVQSIIEKHGGHVHVISAVGEGTRFIVWLPPNAPGA